MSPYGSNGLSPFYTFANFCITDCTCASLVRSESQADEFLIDENFSWTWILYNHLQILSKRKSSNKLLRNIVRQKITLEKQIEHF